jgi:predicted RNase H-like HicB family nuclease
MTMSARKIAASPRLLARMAQRRAKPASSAGATKTPNGYPAVLKRDRLDGGWVSYYPTLPGCMSQGETPAEALANLDDAIAAVLRVRNRAV